MDLRLVVSNTNDPGDDSIVLCGNRWCLQSYGNTVSGQAVPDYHCISYTWGKEKVSNFFGLSGEISSRTQAALEAAIACTLDATRQAFWIDALCVPSDGPGRYATLESMGHIYSRAKSVIVALQAASWNVITYDARSRNVLSDQDMEHLEKDEWVNSVWTYQEIVNARKIQLTSLEPGPGGSSIAGDDFLNSIGYSLDRYKKRTGCGALGIRERFPMMDALETVMADYLTMGYLERSMLACLSGISRRRHDPEHPRNRMYALLGALTQEPSWGHPSQSVEELMSKAMQVAEQKSDYSFIFTSDPRNDTVIGQGWKPKPVKLTPIISWDSMGKSQPGRGIGNGVWLENMVSLQPTDLLDSQSSDDMRRWLGGFFGQQMVLGGSVEDIEANAYEALVAMGFTGSQRPIKVHRGLLFTQVEAGPDNVVEAHASSSISWAVGNPAIVKIMKGDAVVYSAGVYFGWLDRSAEKIPVLLQ